MTTVELGPNTIRAIVAGILASTSNLEVSIEDTDALLAALGTGKIESETEANSLPLAHVWKNPDGEVVGRLYGCMPINIPQEEVERIIREKEKAEAERDDLTVERDELRHMLTGARQERDTLKAEVERLKGELDGTCAIVYPALDASQRHLDEQEARHAIALEQAREEGARKERERIIQFLVHDDNDFYVRDADDWSVSEEELRAALAPADPGERNHNKQQEC